MIGFVQGTLVEKTPPEVVIEVSGIGYEIQMPMTSIYQLPETGCQVKVYTHFVVREDAQLLFGFANKQERVLFRELIKANGVGPKMALTIMSGISAEQFVRVVEDGDAAMLVKLPGVGRKTAERLLVEMKDKLSVLSETIPASSMATNVTGVDDFTPGSEAGAKEEAISALVALGYKQVQAQKMVKLVSSEFSSSEDIIREALRSVA